MINDYCFEHGLDLDDLVDGDDYEAAQEAWQEFLDFVEQSVV